MTTTSSNKVAITGNTYPVKEKLKELGARWNGEDKCWMVDASKADEARAIVSGAGAKKPASRTFGARSGGFRRQREDESCELCGRNRYTCGHCIGW